MPAPNREPYEIKVDSPLVGEISGDRLSALDTSEIAGALERRLLDISRKPAPEMMGNEVTFVEKTAVNSSQIIMSLIGKYGVGLPVAEQFEERAITTRLAVAAGTMTELTGDSRIKVTGERLLAEPTEWILMTAGVIHNRSKFRITETPALRGPLEDYGQNMLRMLESLAFANDGLPLDDEIAGKLKELADLA